MSELSFSDVKVHNEIEYCIVQDMDTKMKIERAFLNNRISYYEKWEELSLFRKLLGDGALRCTLCINSMQAEKANELLADLNLDKGQVEMVMRKVDRTYF